MLLLAIQLDAQNLKSIGLRNVYIQSVAIDITDPNIIYAGGGSPSYGATKRPGLFKTTNGGVTWDTLLNNKLIRDIKIDPKNPKTIYAAPNGVIKSTNSGLTWEDISNGINTRIFSYVKCIEIDPVNTNIMYVGLAGHDGGDAYKSLDGGKNWRKILDGNVTSIAINPLNPSTLFVVNGNLCKSLDGGESWLNKTSLDKDIYWVVHIDESNVNKLFSSGYTSGVFKSTDGGETWLSKNSGFKLSKSGYAFQTSQKNDNHYTYVINGDAVYESLNDGDWKELNINKMVAGCILEHNGKLYIGANGLYVYTEETNLLHTANIPDSFELYQNYPNPFNPETTIKYTIPVKTRRGESLQKVSLKVYDLLGREVATLVDEYQQAGTYNAQFSIINFSTRVGAGQLSSGVYFYRLQSDSYSNTKKLILLK
jgi:photosystem II stability/assembly factor-like uncharacterized protein